MSATPDPSLLPTRPAWAGDAVYVDCKGVRDAAPVVVGTAVGEAFDAVVTDDAFADAALARDLRVATLEDAFDEVLRTAAQQGRAVVTFDRRTMDRLLRRAAATGGPAPVAVVVEELPPPEGAPTLAGQLAALGQPLPARLSARHTAPRLRAVRQQLLRHGAYDALTATAKGKWTKLLQQCRSDCLGLRRLALLRARQLETAGAGADPR